MISERTVAENAWEVDDGLYRILLPLPFPVAFVNAYLVTSQGQYMLVDCGLNWDPSLRALGRALKAIGVPAGGLNTLLLTHRHQDHAGASGPVQRRWGGRTLLHPQAIGRQPASPEAVRSFLTAQGVDPETAAAAAVPSPRPYPEELPAEVEPLPVGGWVHVGDRSFAVIPVPGHAPDMVMLHEPTRRWLMTADQVMTTPAPNVWVHPNSPGDPLRDYLLSMDRTVAMEGVLVLPSHGMPRRRGLQELARATVDFHRQGAEAVRAAISGRRWTTWELTRLTNPTLGNDRSQLRGALGRTLAALTYLAGRGSVARGPDGRWEER